jgi:hypothetical protein
MAYYRTNFNLQVHHNINPDVFDNKIPWEKKMFLNMLDKHIKEKNQEIARQQRNSGAGQVQHPGDF